MRNIKSSNFTPTRKDISETGVLKHFTQKHREWNIQEPLRDFLEKHLFFISINFNLDEVSGWQTDPTTVMNEFSRLYFRTSKQLVGSNLGRKVGLQPLAYAFIDFEGTRTKTQSADILKSQFPHIHAVALVRPEHVTGFQTAMQAQTQFKRKAKSKPAVRDCHITSYSRDLGCVEDSISYCIKGWKMIPNNYKRKADLWEILPAIKERDKMPIAPNDYRLLRKASNGERRRAPA